MVKKKSKSRSKHQKDPNECDESSEEDTELIISGKTCPHVARGVSLQGVKKVLKNNVKLGHCQVCESSEKTDDGSDDSEYVVWMCLQCGYQGCGRNSPGQHALQHYQTPRSDNHALVLNLVCWNVWCYDCDEEVIPDWNKKLMECVEYLRRHSKPETLPNFCSSVDFSQVDKRGGNENEDVAISAEISAPKKTVAEDVVVAVAKIVAGSVSAKNTKFREEPSSATVLTEQNKKKVSDNSVLENLPKIKGLNNLGNTCFFNAVMQSLAQTHVLTHALRSHCLKSASITLAAQNDSEVGTMNELCPLVITIPDAGTLTQSLSSFMKDVHSMGRSRMINPGQLFGQVCKRSPQFRGMMQQDSHELLRHLLDGLKSEETKRYQTGILKAFGLTEKANPKDVDEKTKVQVKAYGKLAPQTIVDRVFSGQLISTVLCEECRMSSQVFEPFLDLSLPVAEEKPIRPGLVKKQQTNEPEAGCFGKVEEKPSKHQEKKSKKQAKREAKIQRNKVKHNRKHAIDSEANDNNTNKPAVIAEEPKIATEIELESDVAESTTSQSVDKDTPDTSDADEEDNAESESAASLNLNGCVALVEGKDITDEFSNVDGNCSPTSKIVATEASPEMSNMLGIEELCQKVKDVRIREDAVPNTLQPEWNTCNGAIYGDDAEAGEKYGQVSESNGILQASLHEEEDRMKHKQLAKVEWMTMTLTTLAPRYQPASHECSIYSCLNQFTAPELLTGSNKFGCENCTRLKREKNAAHPISGSAEKGKKSDTVYTNASKQLLICNPPVILTLHLKRFQQVGYSLRKVNRHVEFPLILDLASFCSSICLGLSNITKVNKKQVMYQLYAVVEHSGRLSGGHYTAFVKLRPQRESLLDFLNAKSSTNSSHCDFNKMIEDMHSKLNNTSNAVFGNCNKNDHSKSSSSFEPETIPSRWYHVSDGHVVEVSESAVMKCQAYLLFYERIL